MKVKSQSEVAQSCLTLCDPMDCSLPGSSVHGIFQARVLEWGAIVFSVCVCVCVCVYKFLRFFSIIGYYKVLNTVPCALQKILLVIYFIYSSLYLLIPNS